MKPGSKPRARTTVNPKKARAKVKSQKDLHEGYTVFAKIIIMLYAVVGLSSYVTISEYEALQWFYFSLLNIFVLYNLYKNAEYYQPFLMPKKFKRYIYIFLGLFVISFVSIVKAVEYTESLVQISRLVNIFIAIFCLFNLVKKDPKSIFVFLCKIFVLLMAFHSIKAVYYFVSNNGIPRSSQLVSKFKHNYANINIFTAALIMKIPFAIYLFLYSKNIWKYISAFILILSVASLMFIGSRTAMLSFILILVVLLVVLIYNLYKTKNKEQLFPIVFFIALPFIAFFLFANTNKIEGNMLKVGDIRGRGSATRGVLVQNKDKKEYKELAKTAVVLPKPKVSLYQKALAKSGRQFIWESAITTFLNNPILGIGYGNFKIFTKKDYFKKKKKGSGKYSKPARIHNDFFEKFVETGIIGGVLFLSLFIFPVLVFIKLFKKQTDKEHKIILLMLFFVGLAYGIDSFFNFPIERAPVALFLILVTVFLFSFLNQTEEKQEEEIIKKKKKIIIPILFVICSLTAVSNYLCYRMYELQTYLNHDLSGKDFFAKETNIKYGYDSIKKVMYNYPKIDRNGSVFKRYLAQYAVADKKYEKALDIINNDVIIPNADNLLAEKLKALIYLKPVYNLDSAEYYSRRVYEKYPAYKHNYDILKNVYKIRKDHVKLLDLMNSYTKQNYPDVKEWKQKIQYHIDVTKDIELAKKVLDTAIAYNPNSIELFVAKGKLVKAKSVVKKKVDKVAQHINKKETQKMYTDVVSLFNKKQYKEAKKILFDILKIEPKDHFAILYIGIMDMNLKNYTTAVGYLTKAIESKKFKDGKGEYCRGFCYEKLGLIDRAKKDYKISRKAKYGPAMQLKRAQYE